MHWQGRPARMRRRDRRRGGRGRRGPGSPGGGRALRAREPRARFRFVVEHDQERDQAGGRGFRCHDRLPQSAERRHRRHGAPDRAIGRARLRRRDHDDRRLRRAEEFAEESHREEDPARDDQFRHRRTERATGRDHACRPARVRRGSRGGREGEGGRREALPLREPHRDQQRVVRPLSRLRRRDRRRLQELDDRLRPGPDRISRR